MIGRFGWLFPFHFLHHFYLLALPPLFPLLRETLVPSYTMLGLLKGTFTVMGFLIVFTGRIADRIGERKAILLEFMVVPFFLIGAAFAPSYWVLLVFVAGFGAARCMYHPAGLSYLSKSVDPQVRGKALGIHESIGSLGGGLAFIALGALGGAVGWRWTLFALALPGFLLVAGYLYWKRDQRGKRGFLEEEPKREEKTESDKENKSGQKREKGLIEGMEELLGLREGKLTPFYLQMSGKVIGGLGKVGFVTFLASFLTEVYGMSAGLAGGLVGVSYLGGFFGNLVGGKMADLMGPIRAYVSSVLVTALLMLGVGLLKLPLWSLILILISCFFFNAAKNPSDKSLLAEHSHEEGRGTGYGSYFTFGKLGALVSSPLFGLLIERIGMRPTYMIAPAFLVVAAGAIARIGKYRRRRV